MNRFFLLLTFLLLLHTGLSAQRSRKPTEPIITGHYISGLHNYSAPCFSLRLVNIGTVPVFIKLDAENRRYNLDTLFLYRTNAGSRTSNWHEYELDRSVDGDYSCLSWYVLYPLFPGDSAQVIIKPKDFDTGDTAKLICSFTREILPVDREMDLYRDQSKILLQHGHRNFESLSMLINKGSISAELRLEIGNHMDPVPATAL